MPLILKIRYGKKKIRNPGKPRNEQEIKTKIPPAFFILSFFPIFLDQNLGIRERWRKEKRERLHVLQGRREGGIFFLFLFSLSDVGKGESAMIPAISRRRRRAKKEGMSF